MVRKREPRHPLVPGKGDEILDPARPVEQRILRVTVQVRESAARRNRQPTSLCSRVSATPLKRAPPVACSPRRYPTRATIRHEATGCPEYLDHKLRHVLQDFSFRVQVTGFRYQVRVVGMPGPLAGKSVRYCGAVLTGWMAGSGQVSRDYLTAYACNLNPYSSSSFHRNQFRAIWALRTANRRAKRPWLKSWRQAV